MKGDMSIKGCYPQPQWMAIDERVGERLRRGSGRLQGNRVNLIGPLSIDHGWDTDTDHHLCFGLELQCRKKIFSLAT